MAIVRLSGDNALGIATAIFRPGSRDKAHTSAPRDPSTWISHRVYYGNVVDRDGAVVDEVLLLVMKRPRSYTKEDVVEVHCHGGAVCVDRVLHTCVAAGTLTCYGEGAALAYI